MRRFLIGFLLVSAFAVGVQVALAGQPRPMDLTVKPSSVKFGRVLVGDYSRTKDITFTNATGFVLSLDATATNAAAPPGFGFSNQGCNGIPIAATCTSTIVFHPAAAGVTRDATWTITYTGGGQSYPVVVTVSGTGVAP